MTEQQLLAAAFACTVLLAIAAICLAVVSFASMLQSMRAKSRAAANFFVPVVFLPSSYRESDRHHLARFLIALAVGAFAFLTCVLLDTKLAS